VLPNHPSTDSGLVLKVHLAVFPLRKYRVSMFALSVCLLGVTFWATVTTGNLSGMVAIAALLFASSLEFALAFVRFG
jgi:hypothetical protein